MAEKTIKILYKQPVTYKLFKDGYKTVTEVINAYDGMPKVLELDPPSELYESDMVYNINTDVEGEPLVEVNSFTKPDDTTCAAKTYSLMPVNSSGYKYNVYTPVEHEYYTKYGSVSISNKVASNFSGKTNYLKIDNIINFNNKNYEMVVKFNLSDVSPRSKFYGSADKVDQKLITLQVQNGHPGWSIPDSTGSSWQSGDVFASGYNVNANTWYWMKLVCISNVYTLYMSTDGIEWNSVQTYNGTTVYNNTSYHYMVGGDIWGTASGVDGAPTRGSIDLSECYIKINDELFWAPYMTTMEMTTKTYYGCLDATAGMNDYTKVEEYKCYHLQKTKTSDDLRLTKDAVTGTSTLYNQYIKQVETPIRDYKWYYKSYPTHIEPNFYNAECDVIDNVAMNFTEYSMFEMMLYGMDMPNFSFIFNIETGDMLQDCGIFKMADYSSSDGVFVCHQNKFDGGKLLFGNSQLMLNPGITALVPHTKYWLAVTYKLNKFYVYLLPDTGLYTKETLPTFESGWTQEGIINFQIPEEEYYYYPMTNLGNTEMMGAKIYDSSGALITDEGAFYFAGGKVYLNNTYAAYGPDPAYGITIWEPYRYLDYVYTWAANKSLYSILEHNNFANYLDFSKSYVNVSETTWDKYVNPIVCMMPKNGGEDDHTYVYRTQGELVDYTNLSALPQTLLDGSNFEISGGVLRNGSKSYNVNNGYSYGYLKLTPTQNITVTVNASCSSESNWDYGACYIGTAEYKATRDQIKNKTTDGNGSWLFSISGTVAATNYTTTLNKDVTYYVQFYYAKDGTQQAGDDRVYIRALTGFVGTSSDTYSSLGCIADGSTDDGTEQQWDVYYPSDFSQPILVNHGQAFSGGTKVDTITLPAHTTYTYEQGGTWTPSNTNE